MEEKYWNNKEAQMERLKEGDLQNVGEELQNENVDLVLEVLAKYPDEYGHTSSEIWASREAGLVYVKNGGEYKYLATHLRRDKEILLEAIRNEGNSVANVPRKLEYDDDILEALENPECINGKLEHLREERAKVDWSNKEDVLGIMKLNGYEMEENADPELFKDPDFILRAQKIYPLAFAYADKELWKKEEFVLAAAKINGYEALRNAKGYEENREVVLEAVKQNGRAICFAEENVIDREIALAAVSKYGSALEYAKKYQNDSEIALAAVRQYSDAIKFVGKDLRRNPGMALEFLKSGCDIGGIDKSLWSQEEFLAVAKGINRFCMREYVLNTNRDIDKVDILKAIDQNFFRATETAKILKEEEYWEGDMDGKSEQRMAKIEVLTDPDILLAEEHPELIPEMIKKEVEKRETSEKSCDDKNATIAKQIEESRKLDGNINEAENLLGAYEKHVEEVKKQEGQTQADD